MSSIIVFYISELVNRASFMLRGPEETVSMGKFIVNFNCKVIVHMCVFGLSLI